jgi:hypothetical protein
MVFNATFNNISVISWWSVLQVEKIGVHRENHALPQVTDKNYRNCNVVLSTLLHQLDSNSTTLMVIGTDCICCCKRNYHTITTMTVLINYLIFLMF